MYVNDYSSCSRVDCVILCVFSVCDYVYIKLVCFLVCLLFFWSPIHTSLLAEGVTIIMTMTTTMLVVCITVPL